MLHSSAKIYGDRPYYKPEVARTWFKLAAIQRGLGDKRGTSEAQAKADSLLSEISRARKELLERRDLDDIIQYWAL
jgi:hypothetical protein